MSVNGVRPSQTTRTGVQCQHQMDQMMLEKWKILLFHIQNIHNNPDSDEYPSVDMANWRRMRKIDLGFSLVGTLNKQKLPE